MSSDDYLNKKLRPIFNAMTESIIRETPKDPVMYMLNWLQNYNGRSSTFDVSAEKFELMQLKKEMKRYEKKFGGQTKDEDINLDTEQSAEEDDEEQDRVEDLIEQRKQKAKLKGGRASVSAEVYGTFNVKQEFVPKVIEKTEDQISRIQDKVLKSFIFNNLDEKELKIVIDAMEEYTCKKGDYVITQGDPGAVLYIIEKGTYDCYKEFVSFIIIKIYRIKSKAQLK